MCSKWVNKATGHWWYIPAFPALERLRQGIQGQPRLYNEYQTSQECIVKTGSKVN